MSDRFAEVELRFSGAHLITTPTEKWALEDIGWLLDEVKRLTEEVHRLRENRDKAASLINLANQAMYGLA